MRPALHNTVQPTHQSSTHHGGLHPSHHAAHHAAHVEQSSERVHRPSILKRHLSTKTQVPNDQLSLWMRHASGLCASLECAILCSSPSTYPVMFRGKVNLPPTRVCADNTTIWGCLSPTAPSLSKLTANMTSLANSLTEPRTHASLLPRT